MAFTWPDLIPDEPLVTPHQLCRCCRRFAETIIEVYPARKDGDDRLVCEHYDSLQDLIDGAQGGCHVCNISIDYIKQQSRPHHHELPVWLQSRERDSSGEGNASETKITTRAHEDENTIFVFLWFDDGHRTNSFFEIKIKIGDSIPVEKTTFSNAQLSNHVASDAHFDLIQRWLSTCTGKAQHSVCNIDETFQRPTRLLDLARFEEDVSLINGDVSKGSYAALSYSWGSAVQLKTFRSNLREFQERIPFNKLSRVTQDAIRVCRKLSILYLWIDALCIIQGDDGDFSTEAPRMQDVYAGSLLTIVAADSKDTTGSFLGHRNPLPWLDCTLEGTVPDGAKNHFKVEPIKFCKEDRKNSPGKYHVDSRAWCLQERFMSPRSVYFGSKGIHWECRTGLACENILEVKESHSYNAGMVEKMKSGYAELQSMQSQLRSDNLSDVSRVHQIWNELVRAYSRMQLSHSEDVLIAISGIASVFEPVLQSECTYGMWVCRIPEELLWKTTNHQKNSPQDFLPDLPSWSWISAYGRLHSMPQILRDPRKVDDMYVAEIVSWPSDTGFSLRLRQSRRDTRICMKGHLAPYTETWTGMKYESHWWDHQTRHKGLTRVSVEDLARVTRFVVPDFDLAETTLFCLLLRCNYRHGVYRNEGLLLTPVDPSERIYRRVGVIEESHPASEFPDAPPSSFVQGKFLVDLWAPLGEEQKIYII